MNSNLGKQTLDRPGNNSSMNTEMLPLVSVVLPAYNVAEYIEDALASILNQDYQNIEIIVIDDGSSDNTAYVAREILQKGNRPYEIVSQENKGVSAARNHGIALSKGNYFICLDPDDELACNAISSMTKKAYENHLQIVASNYQKFSSDVGLQLIEKNIQFRIIEQSEAIDGHYLRTLRIISPGMLIEASLKTALKYDESVRFEEDLMFVWDALFLVDRIGYFDTPFYKYRTRLGSTMTAPNAERIVRASKKFRFFFQEKAPKNIGPDMFYGRWLLGVMHVLALASDYGVFLKIYKDLNVKTALHKLQSFPQLKVRILAFLSDASVNLLFFALLATRFVRET